MSKLSNYIKTEQEVLALGFTQEQINDAKISSNFENIDKECFEIFDIVTMFQVRDNKIHKYNYINYKGHLFHIYKVSKSGYHISTTYDYILGFGHERPSLYSDFDRLAYSGNKIIKFNKKNLLEMLECAYNQQVFYLNSYKNAFNILDNIKKMLVDNGFELLNNNRAFKKSKDKEISIEVSFSDSGNIQQKITSYSVDFKNLEATQKRFEKLNALLD